MIRLDGIVPTLVMLTLATMTASCGGSAPPPDDQPSVVVVPPIQTIAAADEPPPGEWPDKPDPPRTGPAHVAVACQFTDGWVSVLPTELYDPGEEFLMQALIGLAEEPSFWEQAGYGRFRDHRATRCTDRGTTVDVPTGSHYLLIGWANQFSVKGQYRDNGYLEQITLQPGETRHFKITTDRLTHTWLCISCPYLLAHGAGGLDELGQVLVDRYTRRRKGTDVVQAQVAVRDGRVTLTIAEREPEITHLDAIEVTTANRRLSLALAAPAALRQIDGQDLQLSLGEQLDLVFEAPAIPDGLIDVEIHVTGHYEPVGPLL